MTMCVRLSNPSIHQPLSLDIWIASIAEVNVVLSEHIGSSFSLTHSSTSVNNRSACSVKTFAQRKGMYWLAFFFSLLTK